MPAHVIGRDAEFAALLVFLDRLPDGPSAAVLEGEAGAGKTTLWRAAVQEARARGVQVLEAQAAQAETALSYSAVADLLEPVLDSALEALPPPQRRALGVALLVEDPDGPPPDQRAVGAAVLGAFEFLALSAPLLLAVDDIQWLDSASSAILAYAARRLRAHPAGVLFTRRPALESVVLTELRRSLRADRFREIEVGSLDAGALHRVVQDQLAVVLPRPLVSEVHAASGGNPFYALEIVRMLQRTRRFEEAGGRLPVPESLRELVLRRVLALPPESREFLLAAASLSHPTVPLAEAATGLKRDAALPPALDARVVELEGDRLRFTHPLLASAAYEAADPLHRAALHARLAELVEDPEARGRHLAASVDQPSETVAAALDEAARHARARGAPHAAALLLDRAMELTPPNQPEEALRRAVDAALLHFESGDSPRAEAQLHAVITRLTPGRNRARALMWLARVLSYEAQAEATALFLQAIDEAEGDRGILAVAHEGVANCFLRMRERLEEGVEHAEVAAALALEVVDDGLAAEALGTRLLLETVLGREAAAETGRRALELQHAATDRRIVAQPLFMAAVHWWWTDQLERSRDALIEMLQRSRDLGDESSTPYVLVILGQAEYVLGELHSALQRAAAGQEASEQSGQHAVFAYHLALESLVEAQFGRVEKATAAALRALERAPETGGRAAELGATAALGHLALALGDEDAAVARLASIVAFVRREGICEAGATRFVVDQIEALIALGRRDEAVELLDWYEGNARRLERASALANCLRCRGLLASAEGRIDDALACHAEALDWHAKVDLPLDRGRTLLALGAAQRRAKRRREARQTLDQALELFDRLGAALWAERCRVELARIGGRAPAAGALTPAEERIAALVAEGRTNREVAAALFLSERTVEGHLSRAYGKLGVRSRAELARLLASRETHEVTGSNTGDSPVSVERVPP